MELEYSPLCGFDYVKLFNGDWGNEEMRLGTFCGNLTEDISRILSTGTAMTIQFITDHSIHHSGFKGSIDFTIGKLSTQRNYSNIHSTHITLHDHRNIYLKCS